MSRLLDRLSNDGHVLSPLNLLPARLALSAGVDCVGRSGAFGLEVRLPAALLGLDSATAVATPDKTGRVRGAAEGPAVVTREEGRDSPLEGGHIGRTAAVSTTGALANATSDRDDAPRRTLCDE